MWWTNCYVRFSKYDEINNKMSLFCSEIKLIGGKCKVCGCRWNRHMQVTYELRIVNATIF
ncbi:hypothetical protein C1646_717971 [Rhizophagus diaphanus]|nr:hypothetical protein C1646_717971 [Rhizophagus diaphanus] [Rhizophagus sp. MUCL 43196]